MVLTGETPRLIDEWQIEPALWNHVRRAVDRSGRPGRFILTGSAAPADDIARHTGAGRISRLRLRTMTLAETRISTGEISLRELVQSRFDGCPDPGLPLQDLAVQICRGGWPGHLDLSDEACLTACVDYLEEIRRVDISRPDSVRRAPENVGRVLRSLARSVATPVSARAIAADAGGDDGPLDGDAVRSYLDSLRRLMVCEEQPAWSPRLRSRSFPRRAPKRHFVDPSLAVAALGASPARLLADLEFTGPLFESMVHRDLSVYARACDAAVYPLQGQHGARSGRDRGKPARRVVRFRSQARRQADRRCREGPAEVSRSREPRGGWAAANPRSHRGVRLRLPTGRRGGGHTDRGAGAVTPARHPQEGVAVGSRRRRTQGLSSDISAAIACGFFRRESVRSQRRRVRPYGPDYRYREWRTSPPDAR